MDTSRSDLGIPGFQPILKDQDFSGSAILAFTIVLGRLSAISKTLEMSAPWTTFRFSASAQVTMPQGTDEWTENDVVPNSWF